MVFASKKIFPLARKRDRASADFKKMMVRVYGFIGPWFLLLLTLPPAWVGIIFLGWFVVYVPGLVALHRQSQNKPDKY